MPVADLIRWTGLKHNLLRIWRPWPPRPLCHISYGWRGQGRPSFCGSRYRCSRPSYEIFRSISQVVYIFANKRCFDTIWVTPIDEVHRPFRLSTAIRRHLLHWIPTLHFFRNSSKFRSEKLTNSKKSLNFSVRLLLVEHTAVEFCLFRFKCLLSEIFLRTKSCWKTSLLWS